MIMFLPTNRVAKTNTLNSSPVITLHTGFFFPLSAVTANWPRRQAIIARKDRAIGDKLIAWERVTLAPSFTKDHISNARESCWKTSSPSLSPSLRLTPLKPHSSNKNWLPVAGFRSFRQTARSLSWTNYRARLCASFLRGRPLLGASDRTAAGQTKPTEQTLPSVPWGSPGF